MRFEIMKFKVLILAISIAILFSSCVRTKYQ